MDTKQLASVHVALPKVVDDLKSGKMGRRDFLRTSTLLGLSATTAYGIAGKITGEHFVAPARAQGTPGGTVRVSMNVMELSDPSLADWSQKSNAYRAVIEPLAKIGADNITRPYLAERWEANDDLTAWTFYLRDGVTWSNGDQLIADDVVANMEKWRDEAHGSSNFSRFSSVASAEAVDDLTVRFNLSSPDLAVPEALGDYPALIVHRDFWNNGGNFLDNPVGTGPYALANYSVAQRAEFTKRTDAPWWGGDVMLDGLDFIDHGEDPSAFLAALASDQVDLLYEISADQVAAVRGMEDLTLYEKVTGQTGIARFHVTTPPFDNPLVRRAVRACIDHDVLLELAFQNLGVPGEDHHVSPIHPEYAAIPRPVQDYDLARRLLAEAGYADGLEIEINCVAQPTWEQNTCQVMAEMMRPAGITLNVNILPGGTYWDRWTEWPFGFTGWTHRPLGVQVLNLAYRSGVPWNESNYANPDFDALLDQANGTLDIEARRLIMEQLETMLRDDSVIIQPYWRAIHTASNNRLQGFELQPAREFDYPAWSLS
ncbi:MAG: ABC transporter substrate-binding protein [Pseudomonadota bacterium]